MDDIGALCDFAGVDAEEYQIFEPPRDPRVQRRTPASQPDRTGQILGHTRILDPVQPPDLQPRHSQDRSRWHSLRSVLQSPGLEIRGGAKSKLTGLRVLSASGGAGSTTVAASLARLFSWQSESVLLADTAPLPLLPFHFGATSASARGISTLLPERQPSGPIYVITDAQAKVSQPYELGWLEQGITWFSGWDRLLIDCGVIPRMALGSLENTPAMHLLVTTPEFGAAVRLPWLLDELSRDPIPVFILINGLDARNALHTEFQKQLRARYGAMALPFVIHRSDLIPEALAEGMTVCEFARDSEPAADFAQLANWVQTVRLSRAAAAHASATPVPGRTL
jgi:cellulose synthase operon protein YhjQ